MRAEASEAERPCVSDVESLWAVSWVERREWADVIDCSHMVSGRRQGYIADVAVEAHGVLRAWCSA
jgi:hypothetical protein